MPGPPNSEWSGMQMARVMKMKLALAGLLAGAVALGTGYERAEAEVLAQDILVV
jgi:hypothetical protein